MLRFERASERAWCIALEISDTSSRRSLTNASTVDFYIGASECILFLELSTGGYSWVSSNGHFITTRNDFSLLKRGLYPVSSTKWLV